MPLADMPARRERSAPSFDDSRPEELERYFSDLELLLDLYNVANNHQRKQAALRYTKVRTKSLWKTTEAWLDQSKTCRIQGINLRILPGCIGRSDLYNSGL
jgi:hypothetical protein